MPLLDPPTLRVMTFNVLHDSVRSPLRPWAIRRPHVMETIREGEAGIVCLQEVSPRQLDDFARDLPEYEIMPGGETGGTILKGWAVLTRAPARFVLGEFFDRGERCPILVRRSLGRCVDTGWTRLESNRTDFAPPHLVNWVRIELPTGRTIGVYNTHLALVRGRTRGAPRDLLDVIDRQWNGDLQVLAGDFNALPSGPVLRALTTRAENGPPPFADTWDQSESRTGGNGTFHWGLSLPGPRLDYILIRPSCRVMRTTVARRGFGRNQASDHIAVTSELRPGEPSAGARRQPWPWPG